MGILTQLEGVEVLTSSLLKPKIWPNTAPGTGKYELIVKLKAGSTALRAIMQGIEAVMQGTPIAGRSPSRIKALEDAPSGRAYYERELADFAKMTGMRVRCDYTERDPHIDGPQQGKLTEWAQKMLDKGDFMLTMKSRTPIYVLDEEGKPWLDEVDWCVVNVLVDSWFRSRSDNMGVGHEMKGVQIVGRIERPVGESFTQPPPGWTVAPDGRWIPPGVDPAALQQAAPQQWQPQAQQAQAPQQWQPQAQQQLQPQAQDQQAPQQQWQPQTQTKPSW